MSDSSVRTSSEARRSDAKMDPEKEGDAVPVLECDERKRQSFRGWTLIWLAAQSLGTVYGDIGTSVLYVYSSTFDGPPSKDELVCALSIIIYTLLIVVCIKYALIVLAADDNGEGGTFALYSRLARFVNIVERDPARPPAKNSRYKDNELSHSAVWLRSKIEASRSLRYAIGALSTAGVCMVISDGILTPAQSVLGAIQGLNVATEISNDTVVGISCGILAALFLIQPFGISKLGTLYSPIVGFWLLWNLAFGFYNLARHDASVLKAFSPYFAGRWFSEHDGWRKLGGILLTITGVEALFADLGAFSRGSIRLSWFTFTFPCILFAYIGQAAYIADVPTAYANPFFLSAPPGTLYPSIVISVLAAVVASQAMITGCFQLLVQAISLDFFPRIRIKHTSRQFHGQIYIGIANWLLMIGSIVVTIVFNDTTRIGHAYGLCVSMVAFITTLLVGLVAILCWRIHPLIVAPIWLTFALYDGLFMSSLILKIPDGAWFTLVISGGLAGFMSIWRMGKVYQWRSLKADAVRPDDVLIIDEVGMRTTEAFGGKKIHQVPGVGIFADETSGFSPTPWLGFLRGFSSQHQVAIFLHMRQAHEPSVSIEDRYTVSRTRVPHIYRVLLRFGYTDPVKKLISEEEVIKSLIHFLERERIASLRPRMEDEVLPGEADRAKPPPATAVIDEELTRLGSAMEAATTFMLGNTKLLVRPERNIVTKTILWLYSLIRDNIPSRATTWGLDPTTVVELGSVRYFS